MKLKFILSSCLCLFVCSCCSTFNNYQLFILRDNPMNNINSVVLFNDSTKVTSYILSLHQPWAYSRFCKSKNHLSFSLKIDNRTEKVNFIRLKDITIVNSGVDSLVLYNAYSYNDSLDNYILYKKVINDNERLRINPNSSDTISLEYISIKKLKYEQYKRTFLNDTLHFFYKNVKTDIQIIGTELSELPYFQKKGFF